MKLPKVPSWITALVLVVTLSSLLCLYNIAEVYRNEVCLSGCRQSDERLARLIKNRFIIPPATLPYNFQKNPPDMKGQIHQAVYVDSLLGNQTSGFFVECGAHRGEIISNSLLFELERNWTGILIEADPTNFMHLAGKNRKVYSLGACLSNEERSGKVKFLMSDWNGGINSVNGTKATRDQRLGVPDKAVVVVQCFPIYSILLALGNPVVDYFSLDVEGAEMGILRTIPWDKVNIRVWTIEYAGDEEVKKELTEYMTSKDYVMVAQLGGDSDLVFAHKSVKLHV